MITINSTKLILVDVDDTLVMWKDDKYFPNSKNIESVKRFHERGHTLIVWSAGGAAWASRIVKELGIQDYFDYAMGKPDWYIDDKNASEFMPEHNRVYFSE